MLELDAQVIVFDLDDTLYLERDFARSGYQQVGKLVQQELGDPDFAERCLRLLDDGQRANIFDTAFAEMGVDVDPEFVSGLVTAYREHSPTISLAPDSQRFLQRVHGRPTGLISDGPFVTQNGKVQALGLADQIDHIVLTGAWPTGFGKPHRRAFDSVMDWSGRPPEQHVYIADNVLKDFVTPRELGWLTIQIVRDGRVHVHEAPSPLHEPDHVIESFDEIVVGEVTG